MRIHITKKLFPRTKGRLKRRARLRKKITGTTRRPRLAVFRSHLHIYVQAIDDENHRTLYQSSSLNMKEKIKPVDRAKKIGHKIAKKLIEGQIKKVVFDRGGYIYHGRIKAVAEGAREAGLKF